MAGSLNFHSPVTLWKSGQNIKVKVELAGVILSVSKEKQPKQFEHLERILSGEVVPSFITYDKSKD